MGYTAAMEAAVTPLGARHTLEELHDTPVIDKGFFVLMGNNVLLFRLLQEGRREEFRQALAWWLAATKGYAPKLVKADSVLDWTRPAQALACQVRALRPAPGAVSALAGETIKIWESRAVDGVGVPGSVIAVGCGEITVACGRGALEIRRLQRAGGRSLEAAAFLRGRPVAVGEQLDAAPW